jgi:AraC-like DNA-binding protein
MDDNALTLGKYRLVESAWRSDAAELYRAEDARSEGRTLWVLASRDDRARFGLERAMRYRLSATAAMRARSPSLARVLEVADEAESSIVALEFPPASRFRPPLIALSDLKVSAEVGARLPWREAVIRCRDLATALEALHAVGGAHGAIRPSHVAISSDSRPALFGFGLGHYDGIDGSGASLERALFGSPESLGVLPRSVDSRSDLYSLGATLHFWLTGAPPFLPEDATPRAIAHLHVAKGVEPPSALVPDLPSELDAIARKLLAKDPEERYQASRALVSDLGKVLSGERGFSPGGDDEPRRICYALGFAVGSGASGAIAEPTADPGSNRDGRSRELAASIADACAAIAGLSDSDEMARAVLDEAMRLSGAQRGYLFIADPDTKALRLAVASDVLGARPPEYSLSIVAKVFEEGESLVTSDARADSTLSGSKSVAEFGLRSVACVPMRLSGAVVGALYLDNPLAQGVFAPSLASSLPAFASLAALALRDAIERERATPSRGPRRKVSKLGENAIERTVALLKERFTSEIGREELERATGLNGDHLGKIFKLHVGVSIASYVSKLRVEKAVELLRGTDLQVADIAFEVGFGSVNAFYRAFESVTGTTPRAYRSSAADSAYVNLFTGHLPGASRKRRMGASVGPSVTIPRPHRRRALRDFHYRP